MDNQAFLKTSIVALFNEYDFIKPKISSFASLSTGTAFKQILSILQKLYFYQSGRHDEDFVYEASEEEGNWAISLKTLNDVLEILRQILQDHSIIFQQSTIDVLSISKNQDEMQLLILFLKVNWLFYAILKSQKSQLFIQPMLDLSQPQQIAIANLMNNLIGEHQPVQEEKVKQQEVISQEFLRKLEEMEGENANLKMRVRSLEKEIEQQRNQFEERINLLNKDIQELENIIQQKDENLHEFLERVRKQLILYIQFQVSSLEELNSQIGMREGEIKNLQENIQEISKGMKIAKESNDDMLKSLRTDLETQKKKAAHVQKLEKQIESQKQQLNDFGSIEKRCQDLEKERNSLKQQFDDISKKFADISEKYKHLKQETKESLSKVAQVEFELQKQRNESMSYMRQLTLKEQEIYQLQSEISDLESALDNIRNEQQQTQRIIENSQMLTEGDEQKKTVLAGILSPKRNLSYELSEVMRRSSFQWDQIYNVSGGEFNQKENKNQNSDNKQKDSQILSHEQKDEVVVILENKPILIEKTQESVAPETKQLDCLEEVVSEAEEESAQELIDFWKARCEELLKQLAEKEDIYLIQKENSNHLEAKLEKFFKEQRKYETELEISKTSLQQYLKELEDKNDKIKEFNQLIQHLAIEKSDLQLNLSNKSNEMLILTQKVEQFEQQAVELQKRREERMNRKKVQSVSLLDKQLKITKKAYEEALFQKEQEVQLLTSILNDLSCQESEQQKQLFKRILDNFNLPVALQQQSMM